MKPLHFLVAIISGALVLWAPFSEAQPQALMPGVVLDGEGSRAMARLENGTLGAFDLTDGRVLWHGENAFEPLLLAGSRLAARENDMSNPRRFRIAWLDPKTGRPSGPASNWIELPDWVRVVPQPGRSFVATAALVEGRLQVHWQAKGWYSAGARPTSELVDQETRFARGSVLANPQGGAVEPLGETRDVSGKAALAEGTSSGHPFGIEPWTAKGREFRVRLDDKGGRQEILLERRRLSAPEPSDRWLLGALNDQVVIAPDRNALIVFHPARDRNPWCTLWRTDEPGVLLELACESAPISATWLGRLAYFLVKTSDAGKTMNVVRAISLASGSTMFERKIHSPPPLPSPR